MPAQKLTMREKDSGKTWGMREYKGYCYYESGANCHYSKHCPDKTKEKP